MKAAAADTRGATVSAVVKRMLAVGVYLHVEEAQGVLRYKVTSSGCSLGLMRIERGKFTMQCRGMLMSIGAPASVR